MKWVVLGIVFGVLFIVAYFICKKIDKIEETNKKIYVDKKKSLRNESFYRWYMENEEQLYELYEQEYCESMTLPFSEFAYAIFTGEFKIKYYTTLS